MLCVKCGNNNDSDAKFCRGCGNSLARVGQQTEINFVDCPKCRNVVAASTKFCPKCGVHIAEARAEAKRERAIAEEQRKKERLRHEELAELRRQRIKSAVVGIKHHKILTTGIVLGVLAVTVATWGYSSYQRRQEEQRISEERKVQESQRNQVAAVRELVSRFYALDETRTAEPSFDGFLTPELAETFRATASYVGYLRTYYFHSGHSKGRSGVEVLVHNHGPTRSTARVRVGGEVVPVLVLNTGGQWRIAGVESAADSARSTSSPCQETLSTMHSGISGFKHLLPYAGGCKDGLAEGEGKYVFSYPLPGTMTGRVQVAVKGTFHRGLFNGDTEIATTTSPDEGSPSAAIVMGQFRDGREWDTKRIVQNFGGSWIEQRKEGKIEAYCRADGSPGERNCTDTLRSILTRRLQSDPFLH